MFRGVIYLKHTNTNTKMWARLIMAVLTGMVLYLLITMISARLVLSESLPETAGGQIQIGAVCIAAFTAGIIYGAKGEHRLIKGLAVGALFAIGILLIKGVCAQNAVWTAHTTLSVSVCLLFGSLGSCILHKRNRKTTKRARKKTT